MSGAGQVLSTMDEAGHRILLRPRPAPGRFHTWRGVVAWALIVLFVTLPFVRIGGRPAFLIDLVQRELVLGGAVFRPTDGGVLMLLGLTVVLVVFFTTLLFGRVWCGWSCPQTVYMEWVFRPLERLLEGGVGGQRGLDAARGWRPRRVLKYAVFAVLSIGVGNVFLAYFVGVDRLASWVQQSPFTHPGGFLVMAAVSALMFVDFAWFREQMCILACPYGRLQTMLIDRQSMVVGYDVRRGEPRGKRGKSLPVIGEAPRGDCVDCKACVTTCPTGIDIRDGLQMECIGCAQCIDACDTIMDKLARPRGLIRYASQDVLAGKPRRLLRVRTFVYPILVAISAALLIWQAGDRPDADVWVLRGDGPGFVALDDGRVSSQLRLRVENRTGAARRYTVAIDDAQLELVAPHAPIEIAAGATAVIPVVALIDRVDFRGGEHPIALRVRDDASFDRTLAATFLGPDQAVTP